MKEQVITPRAGRNTGGGKGHAGEIMQRPTPRGRAGASSRGKTSGWRTLLAYLPIAGKVTLAVIVGILLFAGYRAAASAAFFQARTVDVSGTSRASADEIRTIVRNGAAQTGVWRADLDAISRELRNVAWVKEVSVSRVLPDGLRVRVKEREPRAVVRTGAGKFVWVDEDAVSLGVASPGDRIFMRGWDEDGTEDARGQNRERIRKFMEMTRDLEAKGISRRVSEVNFGDLRDVRAQLTGDDSQIEIQLGPEDFANRLKFALEELDRRRNTPIGPFILYINVAQGIEKGKDHTSIGVSPEGLRLSAASTDPGMPEIEGAKVPSRATARSQADSRKAKEEVARRTEQAARRAQEKQTKKDTGTEKEKESREERVESRPRRVGR